MATQAAITYRYKKMESWCFTATCLQHHAKTDVRLLPPSTQFTKLLLLGTCGMFSLTAIPCRMHRPAFIDPSRERRGHGGTGRARASRALLKPFGSLFWSHGQLGVHHLTIFFPEQELWCAHNDYTFRIVRVILAHEHANSIWLGAKFKRWSQRGIQEKGDTEKQASAKSENKWHRHPEEVSWVSWRCPGWFSDVRRRSPLPKPPLYRCAKSDDGFAFWEFHKKSMCERPQPVGWILPRQVLCTGCHRNTQASMSK